MDWVLQISLSFIGRIFYGNVLKQGQEYRFRPFGLRPGPRIRGSQGIDTVSVFWGLGSIGQPMTWGYGMASQQRDW